MCIIAQYVVRQCALGAVAGAGTISGEGDETMTTAEEIREGQKKSWGSAAEGWGRSEPWYRQNFGPVFDWMCDAVAASPGKKLLDVACGAGQPALRLARRKG